MEEVPEASSAGFKNKNELKAKKLKNLQQRLLYGFLGVEDPQERDIKGNCIEYTGTYHDEKEFVHGDYVMIFPNPDHPSYSSKLNFTFNFTEMNQLMNKFFLPNPHWDQNYSNCFNRAMAIAFKELKDAEKKGKKPHFIQRLNDKAGSTKERPANDDLYDDLDISFFDEKINVGGGYLIQDNASVRQSAFPLKEKKKGPWVRSKEVVRDMCTLLRHVCMTKLAKEYGFKMRSFLSDDGTKIFLVLHAEQRNLHLVAEECQIDKELELAISDIMSLEPLDSSYRPLRLHGFITVKNYLAKNNMQTPENEQLRKQIIEQLERIKYEKIARRLNCKLFLKRSGEGDIINEVHVSVMTWKHYLRYLTDVAEKVEKWTNLLAKPITPEEEKNITEMEQDIAYYEAMKLKKGPRPAPMEIDPEKMRNESTYFFRERKKKIYEKTNVQIIKRIRIEILAQRYKVIFNTALRDCQRKHGKKSLRNLWDYAGVNRAFDAFSDFYNPPTRTSLKKKNRLMQVWKKYQLNERGLMGEFMNMEKLKLIQRMFDTMFNLSVIKENGFLLDYFFLNDPYALNGLSCEKYFKLFRAEHTQLIHKMNPALENLPSVIPKDENLQRKDSKNRDNKGTGNIQPLENIWKGFFYVPLRVVRDYYGEKIALFFNFLNYYIYCSIIMSFFSIGMFFLQRYYLDSNFFDDYAADDYRAVGADALKIATLIFCLIIAIWSSMVSEFWEGKESIFAIKYGQTEFELEELELSSFEGNFHRSFHNDNMNEEFSGSCRTYFVIFLGLITALIFFIGNVAVTIGLTYLSSTLKFINSEQYLYLGVFISAVINTIYVLITGFIFEKLSVLYTNLENHRTASDYELSFTVKVLLFKTVNRLIPLVLIAFIIDYFSFGCGEMHCWDYLLVYYRSMLYVFFVIHVFQYGWASWVFLLKKASYKLFKYPKSKDGTNYQKINKYIYKESMKLNFSPSEELDGTLKEFINMSINFAMNSLFGVCFPVCFPMSALIFFVSLHFLKFKLIKLCKRPKPVGAACIGASKTVFHLIGYLSVLSNAGLICYTSNILAGSHGLSYFVILVMGIFTFKFMVQKFMVKVPDKLDLILKRGSTVAEKSVKGMKKHGKLISDSKLKTVDPIYKVYGCLLESRQKKKEVVDEEEAKKEDLEQGKNGLNKSPTKSPTIKKADTKEVNLEMKNVNKKEEGKKKEK